MKIRAAGWCTGKWLRLYETIRNIASGDMEIPLVVIRLGVTGLEISKYRKLNLLLTSSIYLVFLPQEM